MTTPTRPLHRDSLDRIAATVGDPSRIRTRLIDRVAYASDASHYLNTPDAVVIAQDAAEVGRLLRAARDSNTPVTLRSGGTSLSGQASGEGLMIDVRRNFRRIEVLDAGQRVRVQPGATVRQVNIQLMPYGTKLGPDPASESACTIGGVIANNSSGMACGTELNTYRTLESMVFVLPSGTVIDTSSPTADQDLAHQEPELVDTLLRLQRRVRDNQESVAIIERHFALKNTMGYGLNSFLDFDTPVKLLEHLIIGSEGTLAFVAEAVFRTVPISPLTATTVAVFNNLDAATTALPSLVQSGAATLELMDSTSIRVGQALGNVPQAINGFEVDRQAALLIEYYADQEEELRTTMKTGDALLGDLPLFSSAQLSTDPAARTQAWNFRKGLYASVAEARPAGTTALLEDVVVPVESLAPTCESLQELFQRYGYSDSVIFGHAKDGNIHFMLTDRFEGAEALGRYDKFNDQMVDIILGAHGNLKAEHGTGRAMAPYVRRQYGDELYEVMVQLKSACDPTWMLNPGVILEETPGAHMRNIKLIEPVDEETNRCVECGYCEPVCPSKNLTLTPRQRIVVRRAYARATEAGDLDTAKKLAQDYNYDGIDTCAVDGMCLTACPVGINTGDLIRRLRKEEHDSTPVLSAAWTAAAKNWGPASRVGSVALSSAHILPSILVSKVTDVARKLVDQDTMPRYSRDLPEGGHNRRQFSGVVGAPLGRIMGVYLPACVNSMFGAAGDGPGVTNSFITLLEHAGVALRVPDNIEWLCCATPWSSKGFARGRDAMATRVHEAVRELSNNGELPIISDAVSCTEGFHKILEPLGLRVIDSVSFTAQHLLDKLQITPKISDVVVHPTCSSTHLGVTPDMEKIARAVVGPDGHVFVPSTWGCCAFAGDRGMLHPELTASATQAEADEIKDLERRLGKQLHYASLNRTCELGMSRATGQEYHHILEYLAEACQA
ncbi:FAD-binding protein [Corynebacterium sp. 3HC-13]|uniref:FAD-binding and (Fe-S)-binding domain-containing protein n=1 Tax=Corynebacterium poyangense TaxID=2684405 RepID=UPI001CCEE83F|nr:FAD-binding and (Fe-S)-binding domain-containing protein [Corynebacterium poyangense]MBZ8178338.1 FAD-binding protein [Corynebacterium poyangense]